MVFPPYVSVLISSSHKDTSHVGLGPIHMTLYLDHLFKGSAPTTVTFRGTRGMDFNMNFQGEGGHISAQNRHVYFKFAMNLS